MPRPVSPWTWRRALRDHGPKSPSVLLTLYTIGTWMNRDGFAFPSQPSIAKGIRASVKTVQRHLNIAVHAGWLAVENAGRGGKGWRKDGYRAAVPDDLPLNDLDEEIADAIEAQDGGIEGGDTIVSSPTANGRDTAMSSPTARRAQGEDIRDPKVATNDAHGGDTGGPKVATQLCRTNSHSETLNRTHTQKEAHNAQSRVASARDVSSNGKTQEPEPETQPQTPAASFGELKKALQESRGSKSKALISDSELWLKLDSLRAEGIAKVDELSKLLSGHYADVSSDRLWRVIRAEQAKRQIP